MSITPVCILPSSKSDFHTFSLIPPLTKITISFTKGQGLGCELIKRAREFNWRACELLKHARELFKRAREFNWKACKSLKDAREFN